MNNDDQPQMMALDTDHPVVRTQAITLTEPRLSHSDADELCGIRDDERSDAERSIRDEPIELVETEPRDIGSKS